MKKRKCSNPNS